MPEALIFDVDGTLAETEELHRLAFNRAFAARAVAERWPDPDEGWQWSAERYRALLAVAGGKERIAAYLRHRLGIDPAPHRDAIAALHAYKTRLYAEMMAKGGIRLRDGIAALIAAARQRQIPLAIATTTSRANVEALCRAGFGGDSRSLFRVVAAGDEVAAKKPAPDVYHLALARLGLPASRCVAFEDSANGVAAAKAAGLCCVAAPSFYCAGDDLGAANLLLASFAQTPPLDRLDELLTGRASFSSHQ